MRLASVLLLAVSWFGVTPAQAQPVVFPDPISTKDFQNWIVECFKTERSDEDCQAFQRVTMNDGKDVALVVTMTLAESIDTMDIQIAVPLGVQLPPGMVIRFDSGRDNRVPFSRCTQQGCLVEGRITAELAYSFENEGSASVTVLVPDDGPFTIPLSLLGLNDALDHIRTKWKSPPG